jgi:stage II sporulation protein P
MNYKARLFSFIWYVPGSIFGILLIFVTAGVISAFSPPITSGHLKDWSDEMDTSKFLVRILQTENHSFYQGDDELPFSLPELAFALSANIKPTDIRTFLGRELPGFSIFDTEIVVAGEGTDFTTIPIESAPPMDVLLKEREIAHEKLEEAPIEDSPTVIPDKKPVFIYHSHSWESFTPLLRGVTKTTDAVSSNEKVNVLAVGRRLTDELNKRGIGTEHDTTDMASKLDEHNLEYKDSYTLARQIVQEAMANNEDVNFLIDIHRDSATKDKTTKVINGNPYAKIYFIVGKEHPNYERNLKVAVEINEMLEEKYPGISRGVFKKGKKEGNGIYNQDLSERALLIEFGGVENELTELYNTVDAFADVFSEYYFKTEAVNN